MLTPEQEDKALRDAAAVREILNNDVVKEMFLDLSLRYFDDFRNAATEKDLLAAHAHTKALKDLGEQFQIVIDRGEYVAALRRRREDAEKAALERARRYER